MLTFNLSSRLVLTGYLSFATVAVAQVNALEKQEFKGLPGISLGMSPGELVKLDRDFKSLFAEPAGSNKAERLKIIENDPDVAVYEEIPNSIYSAAIYQFQQGRLVDISSDIRPQKPGVGAITPYLKDLVQRYGRPTDYGMMISVASVRSHNAVFFLWRLPDSVVNLRFEYPRSENETSSYINLKVREGKWADVQKFVAPVLVPTAAEKKQLLAPALRLLESIEPAGKTPTNLLLPTIVPVPPEKARPHIVAGDGMPIGDSDGNLLFMTYRTIEGEATLQPPQSMKEWRDRPQYPFWRMAIRAANGKNEALFRTIPQYQFPAWSPVARRIAITDSGMVVVFDLKNQQMGRMNNIERVVRFSPAWDATGTTLAMSGSHSPADRKDKNWEYDEDIFVTKVRTPLGYVSAVQNRCVARLAGRDTLPIFSPDGKWLYFMHQDAPPRENEDAAPKIDSPNWSLYRVRPDKRWDEGNPPQKIAGGLTMAQRLSWFPDGQRLLVASFSVYGTETGKNYQRGPHIVDVQSKTVTLLKLPALYDPDFPKGWPLTLSDATIRQSDGNLLFSSLRWSGKDGEKATSYIYTCTMDGKKLQRLTPIGEKPLPGFKYHLPGINALNVWEKWQPKPNLGTPVKGADGR